LERSGPRIFVNVPSAAQVAVIDRESMKVVATWPVTGAASNYPIALDEPNHRLFIGCRRPAKVLVYHTATESKPPRSTSSATPTTSSTRCEKAVVRHGG